MGPSDFDERFDALAAIAYRVGYRVLGDRGDAEEVPRRRWPGLRPLADGRRPRRAPGWRGRRRTSPSAAGGAGRPTVPTATPTGPPSARPERRRPRPPPARQAPSALPRRQRQVVVLRYLADLPERPSWTPSARQRRDPVKQHAHRASPGCAPTWPRRTPTCSPPRRPVRPAATGGRRCSSTSMTRAPSGPAGLRRRAVARGPPAAPAPPPGPPPPGGATDPRPTRRGDARRRRLRRPPRRRHRPGRHRHRPVARRRRERPPRRDRRPRGRATAPGRTRWPSSGSPPTARSACCRSRGTSRSRARAGD